MILIILILIFFININSIFAETENNTDIQNYALESSENQISNIDTNLQNTENINVKSKNKKNTVKSSDSYYIIENQKNYNFNNSRIQDVIDNADSGSTIEFNGSSYNDLYLNINKPFNIISKSNTVITNSFNTPVFTISKSGSGTNISGFTVNLIGSFVDSNSASNIIISNNKISTTATGICFNEVYNSEILNNEFLSFNTAISVQKSGDITISKNNITPNKSYSIGIDLKDNTDKNGISILDNNIIGAKDFSKIGINIDNNVQYVTIERNIIYNWKVGINFVNSVTNTNIHNNTISKNYRGLVINGWLDNFSFTKNTVTNSYDEGILFDYDFLGTKNNYVIENNFFYKNSGLDMRSPGENGLVIGKNFANALCTKIRMYTHFYINTVQNGNNYLLSVTDHRNRNIKGLPKFSATLNINGINYNVVFNDGVAYVETNGDNSNSENPTLYVGDYENGLNNWGSFDSVGSDEFGEYLEKYFGYSDNKESDKNKENTNASSNSKSNSGKSETNSGNQGSSSSTQGSSPSSGDSYVSSNTATPSSSSSSFSTSSSGSSGNPSTEGLSSLDSNSESSSSVSSSPVSSTSPSSSSSQSSDSVAKHLSVDEEDFKVAGVGGLVLLIVLVIGMYYREDFFEMMGNN